MVLFFSLLFEKEKQKLLSETKVGAVDHLIRKCKPDESSLNVQSSPAFVQFLYKSLQRHNQFYV